MRILLAPDKFKHTLTAKQVCDAITQGIHDVDQSIEVISHPLADGGEGTLDLLGAVMGLERVELKVRDPLHRMIDSYYLKHDQTAYIEMALASGLQLLKPAERNPLLTSTYGTGELIKHAIKGGTRQIYLMVGGSATNEGGAGMAQALGYQFKSHHGKMAVMCGDNLHCIEQIEDRTNGLLEGINFTVLTDVQNVLLGTAGASFVYGPQKGASEAMIPSLDQGLANLSSHLNPAGRDLPGAGAAGGLGYGAMSFLGAELRSGIKTVIEITGFEKSLEGVDLVITGEGKMDLQTVQGKVVAGVAAAATARQIPFAVICGLVEAQEQVQEAIKAWGIYPLVSGSVSTEEAMSRACQLVRQRAERLISDFLAR